MSIILALSSKPLDEEEIEWVAFLEIYLQPFPIDWNSLTSEEERNNAIDQGRKALVSDRIMWRAPSSKWSLPGRVQRYQRYLDRIKQLEERAEKALTFAIAEHSTYWRSVLSRSVDPRVQLDFSSGTPKEHYFQRRIPPGGLGDRLRERYGNLESLIEDSYIPEKFLPYIETRKKPRFRSVSYRPSVPGEHTAVTTRSLVVGYEEEDWVEIPFESSKFEMPVWSPIPRRLIHNHEVVNEYLIKRQRELRVKFTRIQWFVLIAEAINRYELGLSPEGLQSWGGVL